MHLSVGNDVPFRLRGGTKYVTVHGEKLLRDHCVFRSLNSSIVHICLNG